MCRDIVVGGNPIVGLSFAAIIIFETGNGTETELWPHTHAWVPLQLS